MRNNLPTKRRTVRQALVPVVLCATLTGGLGLPAHALPTAERAVAPVSFFQAADVTVGGRVTSKDNGEGLPGVTVLQKGTSNGISTDADGSFVIKVPAGSTLVFSAIGYVTQELPASDARMSISLAVDNKALGEVVVVGYGTQSRATVTGAISTTDSKAILRTPAATSSSALVGRVPGLSARQADARPGGGTAIQIRNMGSPLYVIDGVISDEGQFNNLGISDIDNISILKDASAAIYGLRAANGVVLVTTKKGTVGKPTISVSGYYGLQNFTRYPHPANAYQHVRGLAESAQNQGQPAPNEPVKGETITPDVLEKWRTGAPGYQSYDYYKMVTRPNVPQYYANASVSGGSENVRYYLSGSHLSQEALIRDYHFKRTNLQANLQANITKRLQVGTQIYGRVEDRFNIGVPGGDDYFNPFLSIFSMWPTESPYANDNPAYINQTHNLNVNPATYKKDVTGYAQDYWRSGKINLTGQYDFDFGLSLKAVGSYNYTTYEFDGFEYTYNAYTYNPTNDTYNLGSGNQNPWRERRTRAVIDRYAQMQANYAKKFGDHNVSALVGYERYDTDNRYRVVHTVPPNNTIPIQLFANQDYLGDEINEQARAGYIGRVNYNYKQKYLIEFLGRYDGSYLFAPGSRYGFFPGVSAGWRLSEEPFLKSALGSGIISELKLRGSYGRTGSDVYNGDPNQPIVAPYSYVPGYDFPNGSSIFNGTYYTGIRPRGLPITTLSWIRNQTANIGIDVGFLDGKLTGQYDIFERRRTGLPALRYDVVVPSEVGYALPPDNLNSDAVRGMEGILTYSSAVNNFTYTVSTHATFARSRDLTQYKPRFGNSWEEYRNSITNRWSNVNWGYEVVGQFQSQQQIADYPINNDGQGNRNQLPGDLIYKDVNGDGVINYLDERPIGYAENSTPYFTYAMNTSLGYKNFTLNFDLVGAGLQTYRREVEQKIPFQNNGTSPDYFLEDRWHHEDPFNSDSPWIPGYYPAVRRDNNGHPNYNRRTDFWNVNVRYLRVRNVQIGYNLPKAIATKAGLGNVQVYVNGTNLYSFDSMKKYDLDPEVSSNGGLVYPQQRLYNLGLNVSF